MQNLSKLFEGVCPFNIDVPMCERTTIKIGGNAPIILEPTNIDEVKKCLEICGANNLDYCCLGACSNILAKDEGVDKVIISTNNLNQFFFDEAGLVYAQAGVKLPYLISTLARAGISGLEWGIGIPGSVGGATYMNSGAFGGQIGDYIEFVDVLIDNKLKRMEKSELFFEYRASVFTNLKNCVIIGVGFLLKKDKKENCTKKINEFVQKRLKTQNIGYASAGSVFKANTPLPPAFMIEKCGLKGLREGDAEVSKVHSGFIVNLGKATCKDVLNLIERVRQIVLEEYKVKLDLEIVIL